MTTPRIQSSAILISIRLTENRIASPGVLDNDPEQIRIKLKMSGYVV